jgi:hypothetical protein
MRSLRLLLCAVLPLVGTACPTEPAASELQGARARWLSRAPRNYRFDYARNCFCPAEAVRMVTITVRDDRVTSVVYRDSGLPVPMYLALSWPTVPLLFEEVARAAREADDFRVTYDRTLGYPNDFYADWRFGLADDEGGFVASNVRAIP